MASPERTAEWESADVAAGSPVDATEACEAADLAQREWAKTPPRHKAEVLRRCWEQMMAHQEELAELIVTEQGKPIADVLGEIAYAAEFFRWNSEEAVRSTPAKRSLAQLLR